MTYSTCRELRKQMYMARNTVCTHENTENNLEICKRLVNLRREIAQLLGFKTYAEYVLKNRMAGNARNVYKLLDDLIDAYKPTAIKEVSDIEKLAKKTEGKDFKVMPWDFSYYSHKLQLKKFNIDSEMLRPYFELSKVIQACSALQQALRHNIQGEQGHTGLPSRRESLRGVRQGRLLSCRVLRRLPSAQGQTGRCMDDRISGAMDRPQGRKRKASCKRGDEPDEAYRREAGTADTGRS
mgnify:CR=1 FL=1